MPITYNVAVDTDDDGDFGDSAENITNDVLALHWRLGMSQAYDSMAAPIAAEITVQNTAGIYSPEITTLLPGKRLRIQSDDGTTTRTHFMGFIAHIEPQPGTHGKRTAIIHAYGAEAWLPENMIRLPILTNVRADEVMRQILPRVKLRYPIFADYLIVGEVGKNTLGRKLFGEYIPSSLETGQSVFAYIGDIWGEGVPADTALWQLAHSERGRFFVNRSGEAVFYNRHHTLKDVTVKATFADDMVGMAYDYGAEVVNNVHVAIVPRIIGTPNTLLWSLAEPQLLNPGVVKRFAARYTDANDSPVGALTIDRVSYTASTTPSGVGTDMHSQITVGIMLAGAGAATLEVRNQSDSPVFLRSLVIQGTPLMGGDALVIEENDVYSETYYGYRRLRLDLPLLTAIEDAVNIARYELRRRSTPGGRVRSLQTDTRQHPAAVLGLTLFDRITVQESQTGHDRDYFIIAEEHHVEKGGTQHRVAWLLEPADDDRFFILGQSLLDGTRYLMY